MLEQALERAPDWPPALFALGEAREKLGDAERRGRGVPRLRSPPIRPTRWARRGGWRCSAKASRAHDLPRAYVARLFDDYAQRFDRHLVEELAYRGPALIAAAIDAAAPGRRFARALDLGCGTGLAGAPLRARVERLEGVDLSPAMLAKARERGLYDALEAADIVDHLRRFGAAFDLIVAADALAYCGDLQPVFAAAAAALDARRIVRVHRRDVRRRRLPPRRDDALRPCARLCRGQRRRGGPKPALRRSGGGAARKGRGRSRPDGGLRPLIAARVPLTVV